MRTCEIRFPAFDARSNRPRIRSELVTHHDITDVLLTLRDDTLCVFFRGAPDPVGWARTLSESGFPRPRFAGPRDGASLGGPRDAAA